jgi:hypothetical protein
MFNESLSYSRIYGYYFIASSVLLEEVSYPYTAFSSSCLLSSLLESVFSDLPPSISIYFRPSLVLIGILLSFIEFKCKLSLRVLWDSWLYGCNLLDIINIEDFYWFIWGFLLLIYLYDERRDYYFDESMKESLNCLFYSLSFFFSAKSN